MRDILLQPCLCQSSDELPGRLASNINLFPQCPSVSSACLSLAPIRNCCAIYSNPSRASNVSFVKDRRCGVRWLDTRHLQTTRASAQVVYRLHRCCIYPSLQQTPHLNFFMHLRHGFLLRPSSATHRPIALLYKSHPRGKTSTLGDF